ncbi:MAG: ketoacyl-ACP synthase III [Gemmatimonadota bacterium]
MLYIHGVGHFHPENVIDNAFLESLDIGTAGTWIIDRVGIRERRTVLPLDYIRETRNADPRDAREASEYSNPQTAARAAAMALDRAGLEPSDVGMVIAGGCSPQYLIPAEACMTAAEIGIDAPALDVNSACSSFVAHLSFLEKMRSEALPDYILIVNAENNTRTVDYTDRSTAVLWGDGTAAAIISPRVPARARIVKTTFMSDPTGWDKVTIPAGGFFAQQGSAVQGFAIRKTAATALELLDGLEEASSERVRFIGHQANLGMLQSSARRAKIDPSRHLYNVDAYGNCGAAGAPTVLSQNWDSFEDGDVLALVTVGSGLSWGGALTIFGGESE